MRKQEGIINRLMLSSELTNEPIPGVPLIEIAGDRRVLIENHRGVSLYGCNEIKVCVKQGCISIKGQRLNLAKMSKQQLVIIGNIEGVAIFYGGKK